MKKIMSLMLGLSLLSGMAVFAQEKMTTKSTKTKSTKSSTSKGKKKKATTTASSGN
jgi:hypothetical protein